MLHSFTHSLGWCCNQPSCRPGPVMLIVRTRAQYEPQKLRKPSPWQSPSPASLVRSQVLEAARRFLCPRPCPARTDPCSVQPTERARFSFLLYFPLRSSSASGLLGSSSSFLVFVEVLPKYLSSLVFLWILYQVNYFHFLKAFLMFVF